LFGRGDVNRTLKNIGTVQSQIQTKSSHFQEKKERKRSRLSEEEGTDEPLGRKRRAGERSRKKSSRGGKKKKDKFEKPFPSNYLNQKETKRTIGRGRDAGGVRSNTRIIQGQSKGEFLKTRSLPVLTQKKRYRSEESHRGNRASKQ